MSVSFIAGYHNLLWVDKDTTASVGAGISIGATGPEGIRLNLTKNYQEITSGKTGPDTIVNLIAQGGNCFIEFALQELNLDNDAVREFLSPARVTDPPITNVPYHEEVGLVGHSVYDPTPATGVGIGGTLFATPVVDTPADLAHQGTASNRRRFQGLIVGDMFETLDVKQNVIPVRFQCIPFLGTNGVDVWWEWV